MRVRNIRVPAVVAAMLALVLGGVPAVAAAPRKQVSPGAVGLDAKALARIAAQAKAGHSNCLVVVRNGKVAGQWYFNGTGPDTTQNVWSATKSFASTLVGIAQDEGDLQLSDRASTYIPAWKGTPSGAITLQQLLSMDSGRQWSFISDYVGLVTAPDRTAYAIALGQSAPPAATWTYNNAAVQTLEQVLHAATGTNVATFAAQRIFRPLGMTHTRMGTDKAGKAQLFEGLQSTCLDMARFGELMLHHGTLDGTRVVSSRFVAQATGRPSTKLNAGYGYLWWLNRKGLQADVFAGSSVAAARRHRVTVGQIVPGAPADMYWAIGLGNQIIQVDPGSQTVVVRLGSAVPDPEPPTFGPLEASRVVTQAVRRR